jgi:superfamily II DNA or RNA helicase
VLRLSDKPLSTGAAAIYPYSEELAKAFVQMSTYDEPFPMYRVFGKEVNRRIALPRQFCPMSDKDLRVTGEEIDFTSKFVARNAEQTRVVTESANLLLKGESFVTRASTGFGKTICAMEVIKRVGRKTLIVVTKEDLRDHWIEAARTVLGLKANEVGVVQGKRCEYQGRKVMVGMVQSLASFGAYPPAAWAGVGLTIFDEVHRMGADHFSNVCWILPSKLRWGLSATPKRADGKDELIEGNIGPVRVSSKQMLLVPTVFITRTDTEFPPWAKKSQTPGRTAHLSKILARDPKRNHFIARFVRKVREVDRRVIVFSDTLAHLDALRSACIKLGIPGRDMAHYVGGLTKQEREAAKQKPLIFATYAYTAEATDIPWLDTMVMATPRSDVEQIVGRILREHKGKRFPLVLDLVDPLKVFRNYAKKRAGWYGDIGAETRGVRYD